MSLSTTFLELLESMATRRGTAEWAHRKRDIERECLDFWMAHSDSHEAKQLRDFIERQIQRWTYEKVAAEKIKPGDWVRLIGKTVQIQAVTPSFEDYVRFHFPGATGAEAYRKRQPVTRVTETPAENIT